MTDARKSAEQFKPQRPADPDNRDPGDECNCICCRSGMTHIMPCMQEDRNA